MQVLNVTDFDGHFEAKGVPSILALTLQPSLVIAHFGSFCAGCRAVLVIHFCLFTFLLYAGIVLERRASRIPWDGLM